MPVPCTDFYEAVRPNPLLFLWALIDSGPLLYMCQTDVPLRVDRSCSDVNVVAHDSGPPGSREKSGYAFFAGLDRAESAPAANA